MAERVGECEALVSFGGVCFRLADAFIAVLSFLFYFLLLRVLAVAVAIACAKLMDVKACVFGDWKGRR